MLHRLTPPATPAEEPVLTSHTSHLMILCSYSEISGFHGIIAGMLVAIKQLTPETEITVLQIVKLRAKVRRLPPTLPLIATHMHQLCAHAIAGLVCVLLISYEQ
jgi:hypothetical protein